MILSNSLFVSCLIFWIIGFVGFSQEPYLFVFNLLSIGLFILGLKLGEKYNKETFERLHQKDFPSMDKINLMIKDRANKYFDSKKLDDKKWDRVQASLTKRAEKERVRFILFTSSFAALFLPIWSSFIIKMIWQNHNILVMVLNVLLIFLLSIFTTYIKEFVDQHITKYYKITKLNEMIDDFRLKN